MEPLYAFPRKLPQGEVPLNVAARLRQQYSGMALRDYFAAQAIATLAGAQHDQHEVELIAWRAYQIADAMLAERVKEPATK